MENGKGKRKRKIEKKGKTQQFDRDFFNKNDRQLLMFDEKVREGKVSKKILRGRTKDQ